MRREKEHAGERFNPSMVWTNCDMVGGDEAGTVEGEGVYDCEAEAQGNEL